MKAQKKLWFTLIVAALVFVTVACSCGSLSNLGLGGSPEPMTGLAGTWLDSYENTTHTITWNGSAYSVSSNNAERGNYSVSDVSWDGSTFTWTYYVAQNDVYVTIQAYQIDGDYMYLNWWSTNHNSGQDTFYRQ
jgi:hypothetical protein